MKKPADRKNIVEPVSNEQEQAHVKRKPEAAKGQTADSGSDGRRGAKDQTGVFFDRLRQAPEDYWDDHRLYVYRRFPRVARNGKPHYEATYRRAIDEEFLKSTHGSGAFLIKLNDNKRTTDQTSVEIQDISYPPKIDVRELVDCPENARYHELWPSADKSGLTTTANNGDAAIRELTGLLKTVLTQKGASEADPVKATLVDWALKQTSRERAQERNENSPTALAALLGAVKSILPDQQQRSEKDKVDIRDRVWGLVERVQEKSSGDSKPDAFSNLNQMVDLFGKLKTTFASESPAPAAALTNVDAELWEKVALTISGQVSNIVSSLPGIIAAWKSNGAVPPIPIGAPVAAPPQAFNPYERPDLARAFARAQSPQQPQPGPQNPSPASAPAGQPGLAPDNGSDAGMVNPAVLIAKGLDCLNRGYSGSDFADSVVVADGDLVYRQIVAQIKSVGIVTVLQMGKQLPHIGQQVTAYETELSEFIQDFIDRPEEEQGPEDEQRDAKKTAANA